jgi:aldehyde dehydrogenase (NAD+)
VNDRHYHRLVALVQDALDQGATIEFGEMPTTGNRFIQPMVLTGVQPDSRLMEEEIFGPVLPVIPYKNIDDAIRLVNQKPKALALYIFSHSKAVTEKVLRQTSSGGVCVNDCGIHFLHSNLPFGGVNNSGMGKSHGYYGFQTFSNEKPVLKQRSGITSIKVFYPPYTVTSKKIMDWFLKFF